GARPAGGVLGGRGELPAGMPRSRGGGEMTEVVEMAGPTSAAPPHRFEAGPPPIAQAIGLGAAVDYLTGIGMAALHEHEQEITGYALEALSTVPTLRLIGPETMADRGGALSVQLGDLHPPDVGPGPDEVRGPGRGGHPIAP